MFFIKLFLFTDSPFRDKDTLKESISSTVFLPKKVKVITINKSHHVNKKAKEHYIFRKFGKVALSFRGESSWLSIQQNLSALIKKRFKDSLGSAYFFKLVVRVLLPL